VRLLDAHADILQILEHSTRPLSVQDLMTLIKTPKRRIRDDGARLYRHLDDLSTCGLIIYSCYMPHGATHWHISSIGRTYLKVYEEIHK
jgi:Fe2+ or Zn2+ uptake regulation protein